MALLACAAYMMLPVQDTFLAPQGRTELAVQSMEANSLARGLPTESRGLQISTAAGPGQGGQPNRINLLFVGTLAGTAVIGLIAILAYGAYSGAGSAL